MGYTELIDALTFLKENRKLGSEADELVDPFKGLVCTARFRFESLSRTFANPHDPQFEGGQTMVGDLLGSEVDFSLLLPPAQTEWAESLERGYEFEISVSFLGFDGLYQRGIFGYQGKIQVDGVDEATTHEPEEETVDFVVEEDPMEDDGEPIEELEEPAVGLPGDQPLEERESPSVQPQLSKEEEVSEPKLPEVLEVPEPPPEEEPAMESSDPVSEAPVAEETLPVEPVDLLPDPEKKGPTSDEIARVMDKKYAEGLESLGLKEQQVYFKERNRRKRIRKNSSKQTHGKQGSSSAEEKRVELPEKTAQSGRSTKIDRSEVMRILDKEFNRGIQSLTEEERRVFDQEQARRKKSSLRKKKNKPEKPGKYRLFLAVMLLFLSVISLGNGSVSLFFFFCFLIVYVLHPWVSFWMEEDPCADLFKNRLFREPKFRRGAGLFLLSLCLFSPAPVLGCGLFFVSLFLMYGTETFKDMQKGFPDEGRRK